MTEPVIDDEDGAKDSQRTRRRATILAFGVLPALALILALASGYLKYVDDSRREGDVARIQAVQTASNSTVAILSYTPDKVEQELNTAKDLLTGEFRDSYSSLIDDVVIPGSKTQQISAAARVSRAGSMSGDARHAVILVFVDQSVTVGASAPNDTSSTVRVTLDKVGDKWLISDFTPV